jgi:hypothetical protein
MKTSELNFCIHSLAEKDGEECDDEDYKGLNIITFCPIEYWKEHECLPDYYFADVMEENIPLPEGYKWYIFCSETQWCSKKSKEEISNELYSLGFVENKAMQDFLSDCWSY